MRQPASTDRVPGLDSRVPQGPLPHRPVVPRALVVLIALGGALALAACSSGPRTARGAAAAPVTGTAPSNAPTVATGDLVEPRPAAARRTPGRIEELHTRNARFRVAQPDDLPGWAEDDLGSSIQALRHSCSVLQRKAYWQPVCANSERLSGDSNELRRYFEREFVFLRVMTPEAVEEGDITGYFEPLLSGSRRRGGAFTVPVYGTPNDLYTLEWPLVPVAQRKSVVSAKVQGREIRLAAPGEAGALPLDMAAFTLDTREKRLRLRIEAGRLVPYYTREQIAARGSLDAPVLAWVDDALALYAMQVQGSGRILLDDGRMLRVGFAEQNGHPFKPLRVAAAPKAKGIVTRGAAPEAEAPTEFQFDDGSAADDADDAGAEAEAPVPASGDGSEADAADGDEVTTRGRARRAPAARPAAGSTARPDQLVDELMPRGPAGAAAPTARAGARPAPGTTDRAPARATARTTARPSARPDPAETARRIAQDPSYVFFRTAEDQGGTLGPRGALGVPLTPERSIAVDPRITPLGYPVYLAAKPARPGAPRPMQKLVFAQDTGGAIRGAVRADHFWGHGNAAARAARSTKLRGEMWLMMPSAEYRAMKGKRLVLRGGAGGAESVIEEIDRECLVPDEAWCVDE